MQLLVTTADGQNCGISFEPGDTLAEAVYLSGKFAPPPLCSGLGRCGLCRVRFLSAPPSALPDDELILGGAAVAEGWRLACKHKAAPGMRVFIPGGAIAASTSGAPLTSKILPPESLSPKSLRLAVDLGTTSLAWAALAEDAAAPEGFRIIRQGQELNPQIGAGSDVLSRLAAALRPDGTARMQGVTLTMLRRIVTQLPAPVEEICLAANTAMTALTRGASVTSLAAAPYALDFAGDCREDLPGLPPLYFPPQVSAFIGADISAGMAALLAGEPDFPFLLADLGTNGEFILALGPERSLAVSVPLGPALEGIGLMHGALAGVGSAARVITAFNLSPRGLQPLTSTAPGSGPSAENSAEYTGISGTGYLSLAHILLKLKLIGEDGIFAAPGGLSPLAEKLAANLKLRNGQTELTLPGGLAFTAGDLEEILKVKAAFSTAIRSLLTAAGIAPTELCKCYLAGALGLHVNAGDLLGLGFLPAALKADKIEAVGNLALAGAKLMLTRPHSRTLAAAWAKNAQVINLTEDKGFMALYLRHMRFCFPRN